MLCKITQITRQQNKYRCAPFPSQHRLTTKLKDGARIHYVHLQIACIHHPDERRTLRDFVRVFPELYEPIARAAEEHPLSTYFFIPVYPTKTHVTIFACSSSNFVMKFLGRWCITKNVIDHRRPSFCDHNLFLKKRVVFLQEKNILQKNKNDLVFWTGKRPFKIVLFITAVLVQDYPARGDITGHYYASGNALDGLKKVQTVWCLSCVEKCKKEPER